MGQTNRQTDRWTDRQTDRQMDRLMKCPNNIGLHMHGHGMVMCD